MPRITLRDLAVTAGCGGFCLTLYLPDVRHAGYYVALAIFVGGLLLGLRAVGAVFAIMVALGIGWVVYATIHPVPDVDGDARGYAILAVTILPAMLSVPAVAGAGVRWLFLKHRGTGSPLRLPRIESPAGWILVAIVAAGGMFVFGYWSLLVLLAAVLIAGTGRTRPY
jgi:hypothetical protein